MIGYVCEREEWGCGGDLGGGMRWGDGDGGVCIYFVEEKGGRFLCALPD